MIISELTTEYFTIFFHENRNIKLTKILQKIVAYYGKPLKISKSKTQVLPGMSAQGKEANNNDIKHFQVLTRYRAVTCSIVYKLHDYEVG